MSTVIFETVHGSHLYGLSHAGSDRDRFIVTDSRLHRARHSIDGAEDVAELGLTLFVERAASGSHQSVEALFSPYKVWHRPEYRPMIEGFRVTGPEVFAKYERTIKKFVFGDFKRRCHAVRLAFGLSQLRAEGRLNPVLTTAQVEIATAYAECFNGPVLLEKLSAVAEPRGGERISFEHPSRLAGEPELRL